MPRKGENIYKRKDGRWEGRFIKGRSATGKALYGYVYANSYREVKYKLHDAITTHTQQVPLMINKCYDLFSDVATCWFNNIQPQVKESTANKYLNLLNSYILPTYGSHMLQDITFDFIEHHCSELLLYGGKNKTGLSQKTVNDVLSVVRNILRFAIRKGLIIPCDGSGIQVKQVPKPMRILSKSEQEKLCLYLSTNIDSCNTGILICLFTGLRLGEVCALHWQDVSIEDKTIYVHQTIQRIQDKSNETKKTRIVITTPKSTCSIRTIPIPDSLIQILLSHKTSEEGFLLTNSKDQFIEPKVLQNRFKKVLEKNDIPHANFHALRHTFATRCIELGFDVKSLSEILGHATVNITMNRYVHPTLELKRENMQRLSSLLAVK